MMKRLISVLFFALFLALSYAVLQMPPAGTPDAPSYNHTTEHYLANALEETGATNVVAAILTDYRAWDTLGETIVLFTAIVAVISVLRKRPTAEVIRDE